jgi:aminoglycoside phosphotransferase (APT) family kinase protein
MMIPVAPVAEVDARLRQFLLTQGLITTDMPVVWTPLTGGVSSDIWRVDLPESTLCVKCALPKLKVARDWRAPISRNAFEWAWINFAAQHLPEAVPKPLAHDPEIGAFAMSFFEAQHFPVWKSQLMVGVVDPSTAHKVANILGTLHAASANNKAVASAFQTDDIFYPIRLEPYLIATAENHRDLAPALEALAEQTLDTHKVLVHGDVSPKNILVGPTSPVLLDAECAWFGDPAFDLAFCLNHFLLKCLPQPERAFELSVCFKTFVSTYRTHIDWESADDLESRAARLLPALFLGRVDGKSPVEYITHEHQKDLVRQVARPLIAKAVNRLDLVSKAWQSALTGSKRNASSQFRDSSSPS